MQEPAKSAIVDENEAARLDGLRGALAVLAVLALVALFLSGGIPTRQPGRPDPDPEAHAEPEPEVESGPGARGHPTWSALTLHLPS